MARDLRQTQVHAKMWWGDPHEVSMGLPSPQNFKCSRCERKLPESQFVQAHQWTLSEKVKAKPRSRSVVYLIPICKTCLTQRRLGFDGQEYYSPELHRFSKGLVKSAALSAPTRGLICAIVPEDVVELFIKQRGLCALSGQKMDLVGGSGTGARNFRAMSIDRVDSQSNYTLDNIQLVCLGVNLMKTDMSVPEFRLWCAHVTLRYADAIDASNPR